MAVSDLVPPCATKAQAPCQDDADIVFWDRLIDAITACEGTGNANTQSQPVQQPDLRPPAKVASGLLYERDLLAMPVSRDDAITTSKQVAPLPHLQSERWSANHDATVKPLSQVATHAKPLVRGCRSSTSVAAMVACARKEAHRELANDRSDDPAREALERKAVDALAFACHAALEQLGVWHQAHAAAQRRRARGGALEAAPSWWRH